MRFYGLFIFLGPSLAKNLANAIFGLCEFFQVPKVALGKNPLYRKVASSNTSPLEAHARFFRLLMKRILES